MAAGVSMEEWVKVFKALSDVTRLKILDMLLKYGFCVGALARQLNMSEAAVSQHLRVLRAANLVSGEKRGVYTYYKVNKELLGSAADAIHQFAAKKYNRQECCQYMTGEHQYCVIHTETQKAERNGEA